MNKLSLAVVALHLASFALKAAQPEINPSHIDVYVTPYYNSKGPEVKVGRFSSGLASAKEDEFLATIAEMRKDWDRLTFPELYVAAIRLYDLGYRKEAVYLVLFCSVSRSAVWRSPGSNQDGKHR
ncbi:MAG: hypothetical protein DMF38_14075 [Verrucomicrobia bacterium]|nr:MAG: hypothetical protein DMF38_14075 [Verrucomicrobiota bacterium]